MLTFIAALLVTASTSCNYKKNLHESQYKDDKNKCIDDTNKSVVPSFLKDDVHIKAGESAVISVAGDVEDYIIEELMILKGKGTGTWVYNKEFDLKQKDEYKGSLKRFHVVCRPNETLKPGLYTLFMKIKKDNNFELHKIKCTMTVEKSNQSMQPSEENELCNVHQGSQGEIK